MRRLAVIVLVAAGCGGARAAQPSPPAANRARAAQPSPPAANRAPRVFGVRVPAGPLAADHATASPLGGAQVLTVAHVLHTGRPVFVAGRRARVLSVDRRLDLAVLAVTGLRAPAAARGEARAGERVTVRALRGPLPAVVRRVVTANLDGQARPALELSAAVLPGDSGAPVIDREGHVLGVVFAGAAGGLAYAVRTDPGLPPPPGRPAPSG